MSSSGFGLAAAAGLLGICLLMVAPPALAQRGQVIRCESNNGKFNRCAMPWRDAELAKQESKGTCVRGQSWGVDRQGLWVDRGCRGLFSEARHDRPGAWRPGPGWDRSIGLQCDSNKNQYQMCMVDVGARGRVQLVKRMSDARCSEGYSWGWNRAGVWVDHGCRGRFQVDRRW